MKVLFLTTDRNERVMLHNAENYYTTLHDIYTELRREWKYGKGLVQTQKIWDRFHQLLAENNVDLDEVN